MRTPHDTVYEDFEALLFSIAYRMLGSAGDAEDLVQETFLRFHRETEAGTTIESPKAWLTTVTTRLAINMLQSARVRRERYVGTWLPEPVMTDGDREIDRFVETTDSLSLAFLVLLESLDPVERAVFLLREVFGYGYDEVSGVVGKSEANCRQIAVRARRQVEARRPRFDTSQREREELSERFFAAVTTGDTDGLLELLATDVVAHTDGGGKAPAVDHPVHGPEHVARLLRPVRLLTATLVEVNGQPGALLCNPAGRPVVVIALDIVDSQVQTIHVVSNPDKLPRVVGSIT